jgi:RNA polymerase sigma factor (sigma-70 family)
MGSTLDVFQATFLVLARKAGAIRGRESLAAWLHRVGYRIALRVRSAQARSQDLQAAPRTAGPSPLDELSARDFLTIVDEELAKLSEKHRLPLVLCLQLGLTEEEAAQRLKLRPATLRGRIERGRQQLRARLARRGLTVGSSLATWPLHEQGLLALPPGLLGLTVAAAVSGAASPAVDKLASYAVRSLLLYKLMKVSAITVVLIALGASTLWGASELVRPAPPSSEQTKAPESLQPAAKKEFLLHGDPLPAEAVMRLGTVQYRAARATLATHPDGKTLVGYCGRSVINLWDIETGKLRETRALPDRWDCALSPDGRWVTAYFNAKTGAVLEVWDVFSGKLAHKIPCKEYANSHAVSPAGMRLAAVVGQGPDFILRLWDLGTGEQLFEKTLFSKGSNKFIAFSPDGNKLLAYFASVEVGFICWDAVSGEQVWQQKTPKAFGVAPIFSQDGRQLWSSSIPLDVATGKALTHFRLPRLEWDNRVAILPDGRTLLVSGADGIVVWDVQSGKEIRRLAGAGEKMIVAPDGKTVITTNGALQRWDVASGKALYPDTFADGHTDELLALVFSPDGRRLASSAADGSVRLWDLATGCPLHVWRAHEASRPLPVMHWHDAGAYRLVMSADGRCVVSAGSEERIRVWDALSGKGVCNISLPKAPPGEEEQRIHHLQIRANGKQVEAFFGAQLFHQTVGGAPVEAKDWQCCWDVPSGKLINQIPVKKAILRNAALTRDGTTAVSSGKIIHVPARKEIGSLEGIDGYSDVRFVLSPDGSLIAGEFREKINIPDKPGEITVRDRSGKILAAYNQAGVAVWESATGKRIAQLKTKPFPKILFHSSNRFLAGNDLNGIHLWDIATGEKVSTRKLPQRMRAGTTAGTYSSCFAFSPDGQRMATGHSDGTVLVWDVNLPVAKANPLAKQEWSGLWSDLKDSDAAKAWRAVWRLAAAGEEAVSLCRMQVKPVMPVSVDITNSLLTDLDSPVFAKRQAASTRLQELGVLAEKALRDRIAAQPRLELQQRIESLLKTIEQSPPQVDQEGLRELRVVAVLTRVQSPSAREVLQQLASGVPSAPLTRAAQSALGL